MRWYILDEQVAWQRWARARVGFGINFSDSAHLCKVQYFYNSIEMVGLSLNYQTNDKFRYVATTYK